jgi:hypothetical protein
MSQRFYSEEEAESILLAASAAPQDGISRDSLLKTAAELGISLEALEEAERAVQTKRQEQDVRQEFERHVRREFFDHLVAYMVVNTFLVLMDLWTSQWTGLHWAYFLILGWGIGLVFSANAALNKKSGAYTDEFEKWNRKRIKKAKAKEKQKALSE